jgi:hypothetical protein
MDFVFDESRHEFAIGVGFGHSGLHHENATFRFGGNLNFMYAFNINRRFAFVTGLEVTSYAARLGSTEGFFDTILFRNPAYTPFGDDRMLYFVEARGVSQSLNSIFLYIPIMTRTRFHLNDNEALFVTGGARFGFPISASYQGRVDFIQTTGFSFFDNQYWDYAPSLGFSTFYNTDFRGPTDLWFSILLTVEFGYIRSLANDRTLHLASFMNLGSSVLRNPSPNMIHRDPNNLPVPIVSSYTGRIDRLVPRSFGFKVRFGF